MTTRHTHECRRGSITLFALVHAEVTLLAMLSLLFFSPILPAAETAPANKWKSAFDQFDKWDKETMPPTGGVVFVGSSSIRLWDLPKSFPGIATINRGFGGSEAADSAKFVEQLVIKYHPRLVVFYAGDNDLAHGKSPQTVCDDVARFVTKVRKALPETTILLLSVKPSNARENLRDKQQQTNELVQKLATGDAHVKFIDVGKVLLNAEGKPRPELFLEDQLHLNAEGYRLWTELLKPYLK